MLIIYVVKVELNVFILSVYHNRNVKYSFHLENNQRPTSLKLIEGSMVLSF